ncbi:MAG TPA: hypothetical protein VFB38_14830 [Chthonomonadaceae bacterium]|nr:hypothetical protein [Chthonomonadaceae bacterium]
MMVEQRPSPGWKISSLFNFWLQASFLHLLIRWMRLLRKSSRRAMYCQIFGKIGRIVNPPVPAALYRSVRKHGRTTRHTVGVVTDISASIRVRYGKQVAPFDNQIAIIGAGGAFSSGGDSGSLIVDAVNLNPVALLFAGGSTTFANPIGIVLARFSATIL